MYLCKKCNQEIVWITTKNNKKMPCDNKKTTIVTEKGEVITGYVPHWSTCAFADEFRKK